VLRVRLRFQKQGDEAVSEIDMEPAGTNAYRAAGPFFNSSGAWTVNVDIRRAEIDDVTAGFPIAVRSSAAETGGQFDYPLTRGGWLAVSGVIVLVLSLLLAVWIAQWPAFPEVAPRLLRVGTAAFSVIGVGLFVLGILPTKETAEGNPIDSTPESVAIGSQLYQADCQQCHGAEGRGDGPLAPTLPVAPADFRVHLPYHQDDFFFLVMTNGLGSIMPAFGDQLTEDERWHLLNFLKSEFGDDALLPSDTPTPTPVP
jgi:mono/diheme cytochrome c family protein